MSSHAGGNGRREGFAPMSIESSSSDSRSSDVVECPLLPGSPSLPALVKISLSALLLGWIIGAAITPHNSASGDDRPLGVMNEGVGEPPRPHQSEHSTNPSKYGGTHPDRPEDVLNSKSGSTVTEEEGGKEGADVGMEGEKTNDKTETEKEKGGEDGGGNDGTTDDGGGPRQSDGASDENGKKAPEINANDNDSSGSGGGDGSASPPNEPIPPPQPRRDDSAFILAGKLPPTNPTDPTARQFNAIPRQSSTSPYALLDPPKPVPNPYGWMRSDDRSSQEVLDHLKVENDYCHSVTAHLEDLRTTLYDELVSGMQETDYTTPGKHGPWWYYTRTYEGKAYPVHCRAPLDASDEAPGTIMHPGQVKHPTITWNVNASNAASQPILPGERIYLDENVLAEGKDYCATEGVEESPTHALVAYTVDYTGDEIFELHVKDMESGEEVDFDERIECDGNVEWGADDATLFYLGLDEAHRPYRVYRRRIGDANVTKDDDDAEDDELLFQEDDELYWTSISKSADSKYLFITTSSAETSEVHYLDLTHPGAALQCVASRRKRILYDVEHRNNQWLITTNDGGSGASSASGGGSSGNNGNTTANFRLVRCRATSESAALWRDMRDNMDDVMFDGGYDRALDHVVPFQRHLVAVGREGGIPRVWIVRFGEEEENLDIIDFTTLEFEEATYDVAVGGSNHEYGASELVLSYDSLITPLESIVVNMDEPDQDPGSRLVLKRKNVPGYSKSDYGCERITVSSRDGTTQIPVSLVYRRSVMEEHLRTGRPVPTHLYGYGSYGMTVEDDFRSSRLPLLRRGMVYVIAHVRGGGEMGRQWYEEPDGAKYLCKQNTFNDFVDVARHLVEGERKLTEPRLLSCEGRSAGGLLIGASLNQAPDLFGTAILGVPFVDVVATMIDASIPLTAGEWEEWGNPNEERFFDYMMSYCPMSNVKKGAAYPSMLLTGGLHDPRVQYWEPTKFAAELRHTQDVTKSGPVCLKMDMTSGHFSASDRYKYLKELAFDYAFLLDQLGIVAPGQSP